MPDEPEAGEAINGWDPVGEYVDDCSAEDVPLESGPGVYAVVASEEFVIREVVG